MPTGCLPAASPARARRMGSHCLGLHGPLRQLLRQRFGPCAPYGNGTATKSTQKAKKSAGANLLTLALLGSPTWARTRDLRINSRATACFLRLSGIVWESTKAM